MKRLIPMFLAALFVAPVFAHAAPMHPPGLDVIATVSLPSEAPSVLPVALSSAVEYRAPGLSALPSQPVIASLDLSNLISADNVAWAVGALFSFLISLAGVSKWLTANRRKWIGFAAHHAFLIVEDLKSNGVAINDKVIAGLSAADGWLAANGFRTLSPQEKEAVRLQFKALNGATTLPVAVAAPAIASPSKPAAA